MLKTPAYTASAGVFLSANSGGTDDLTDHRRTIAAAGDVSGGDGPTVIGPMGRAPSTISRDLGSICTPPARSAVPRSRASSDATPSAEGTKTPSSHGAARVGEQPGALRWSPQQISRALRATNPVEPGMRTEEIYLAIYRPDDGLRAKPDPSTPRTGRDITADTGTKINFCHAGSPWLRGTNENTNGFLRQYFPKSTDRSRHTPRDLIRVEEEHNHRPRIVLGDRTPAELFTALLASQNHPHLR